MHTVPESEVLAVTVAFVDPAVLMALTVMVYLLSSLRPVRVTDLTEPLVMLDLGSPPISEHLLTV